MTGATLLYLPRLLHDEGFRASCLHHVTDPVIRAFWLNEFYAYPPKFREEAIAPVLNKIGRKRTVSGPDLLSEGITAFLQYPQQYETAPAGQAGHRRPVQQTLIGPKVGTKRGRANARYHYCKRPENFSR